MPINWIEEPTAEVKLPSGNIMQARTVDMVALVMSADNEAIPNGLLEQISTQLSGQSPDLELECHSGTRLPNRAEPCQQGTLRGKVVDVTGTEERFTVRVSMIAAGQFVPGEIRFGGNCVATLENARPYTWRIGGGDADKARKELPQLGSFISLVARAASVFPKWVVEVSDPETEWPISRVTQADKMFLFNWAMPREVRPAGMFPQGSPASVAAAPDVQGVSPESSDGVRSDAPLGEVAV